MTNKSLKKIIVGVTVAVVILGISTSSVGKMLPLYFFSAKGVSLATKLTCIKDTNLKVVNKFSTVPKFDRKSINSLKEFWYFSFFKQCLYESGYNLDGSKVRASEINDNRYTNNFIGFSFFVPDGSQIVRDNEVNIEIDNRLYVSNLYFNQTDIQIKSYLSYDFASLNDLFVNFNSFSENTDVLISKEILAGRDGFRVKMEKSQGLVFMHGEKVVEIFSESLNETEMKRFADTFQFN